MTLRRREYLIEGKYNIGFSWDTIGGKRVVDGITPDGKFLVTFPADLGVKSGREILSSDDIDFEIRRDASRLKSKVASDAEKERVSLDKKENENTYGFADSFPPRIRQRIINALLKTMRFDGKIMTRKAYIERKVFDGSVVTGRGSNRRLENKRGQFVDQSQITKTAMDYAEYLVDRKIKPRG